MKKIRLVIELLALWIFLVIVALFLAAMSARGILARSCEPCAWDQNKTRGSTGAAEVSCCADKICICE
ncbi:MAG: hypothetical protein LBC99_11095 [Spirochaetota bacterium]|nr:hypothetical protein [Spirochaetota bacterium]